MGMMQVVRHIDLREAEWREYSMSSESGKQPKPAQWLRDNLLMTRKSTSGPLGSSMFNFHCAAAPVALPRGHERPASKVCLWCGSQHRPKHFNEGAYAFVTHGDRDLRDRFPLCQHLKGGKQPRRCRQR